MYHKKKYPGDKLDKVKLGRYGLFNLKQRDGIIVDLETALQDNWVKHYTVRKNEYNMYKESYVVCVEWASKDSQQVFDDVQNLSNSWAKSCECEPEGNVMVWSKRDRKYLDCGPVRDY